MTDFERLEQRYIEIQRQLRDMTLQLMVLTDSIKEALVRTQD